MTTWNDLYWADPYAWAMEQARALRDPSRRANAIDWDNVAEEIESVGVSQYRACETAIERIMEHMLKIEFLRKPDPVRHWRKEIRNFRNDLSRDLSPSLAAALPKALETPFRRARDRVLADLEEREEQAPADLPAANPYSWDDILGRGENWTPAPRA
ncbi:MAG: DUF29 domain-containing protein [Hyphomonadaceae bacterium]|nr:DUF29 domain-containing protein [Hyphomonadaceae bacterium]